MTRYFGCGVSSEAGSEGHTSYLSSSSTRMNHSHGGASAFPTQKIEENIFTPGVPSPDCPWVSLGELSEFWQPGLPPRGSEVMVQAFRGLEIPRVILKTHHASARLASSGLSSWDHCPQGQLRRQRKPTGILNLQDHFLKQVITPWLVFCRNSVPGTESTPMCQSPPTTKSRCVRTEHTDLRSTTLLLLSSFSFCCFLFNYPVTFPWDELYKISSNPLRNLGGA